jgi:nitrogen fixation NifU-like protein
MAPNELDDLYGEVVLDHCRHPRNMPALESPDLTARAVNPFCGDEVELQVGVESGRVSSVGAQSVGCSINQAATSLLSEIIVGKSLEEIPALAGVFRAMMNGRELTDEEAQGLGDLKALATVRQFPVRIKCALLSWSALEDAIEENLAQRGE